MRIRNILGAMAILVSGVFVGTAAQQLVSAETSFGDRPVLIPITPCRLADTRPAPLNVGPRATKLGNQDTATFNTQQAGTACTGIIPTDAVALSMNVTATDAAGAESFLTIWPGGARPDAASLNPVPGQPPTPNAVTTKLSATQEFSVYNNLGFVNVIIDINGYYVDHNHDDRYQRGISTDRQQSAASVPVPSTVNSTTHTFPLRIREVGVVVMTIDYTVRPSGTGGECAVFRDGNVLSGTIASFINPPGDTSELPVSRTTTFDAVTTGTTTLTLVCHRNGGASLLSVSDVSLTTIFIPPAAEIFG